MILWWWATAGCDAGLNCLLGEVGTYEDSGFSVVMEDRVLVGVADPGAHLAEWEIGVRVDLTNPTESDCPFAVYVADTPPDVALAPILDAAVIPPAEVDGVGWLADFAIVARSWDGTAGRHHGPQESSLSSNDPSPVFATVIGCPGIELYVGFWARSCDHGLSNGFPAHEDPL